jgi:RNA-directed DNA polymerase
MVVGSKADAEALREEIEGVVAPMGLRMSAAKTLITHIDEDLDFLGWHLQRHRKRGTNRYYVYTYPSRKAVKAVMAKVRACCRTTGTGLPLDALLLRVNPVLRGWCAYFRHGVSSATFHYLRSYVWGRVIGWLRRKHRRATWKELRRRYCGGRWWPASDERALFNPSSVSTTWYRYRGAVIPAPWPADGGGSKLRPDTGLAERPVP